LLKSILSLDQVLGVELGDRAIAELAQDVLVVDP
jgi:hypothetical protein